MEYSAAVFFGVLKNWMKSHQTYKIPKGPDKQNAVGIFLVTVKFWTGSKVSE